jgi:hypothetical protein
MVNKLAVLLMVAAVPAWAADLAASSSRWGGVEVHFAATLEPAVTSSITFPGFVSVSGDRVSRIIEDKSNKVYFGYDLTLEPLRNSPLYQLRIEPLTLSQDKLQTVVGSTWERLSLPKYPIIPEIRVGETVAVDLMVNSSTSEKIVDYITLKASGPAHLETPVRDFSLVDVSLNLDRPQLRMNGTLIEPSTAFGVTISGSAVWFYIASHGRFILSLIPHAELGFEKAGEVSDSTLTFKDGSTVYQLDCASRIAPGEGRFLLYIRHDPSWQPEGIYSNEPFLLGAADKAERLIPKK